MHIPEGATPKDGPSAGVTMVTSLLSLALGKCVRPKLAMTGEMSLNGKVLAIGGVKEKVLAAKRSGMKTLIFPMANRNDYLKLDKPIRKDLETYFAVTYEDVYAVAFGSDADLAALSERNLLAARGKVRERKSTSSPSDQQPNKTTTKKKKTADNSEPSDRPTTPPDQVEEKCTIDPTTDSVVVPLPEKN